MRPIVVAPLFAFGWRRRLPGISLQPGSDVVVIALLRPKHSCERLAQDVARVARALLWETVGVELICFFAPQVECLLEIFPERIGCCAWRAGSAFTLNAPVWAGAWSPSV